MTADALAKGFYTVPEAARLIEVGSARRIYGWLRGYRGREPGPLLHRDYRPIGGVEELSFLDLIEVRFVEHFREQGVKTTTLRKALEAGRRIFGEEKPLASDRVRFVTDGRDVFVEEVLKPTARAAGDRALWSLVTRQYEIYALIQSRLLKGLSFDRRTHLARRWVPRPESFPDIAVDPRVAYGQPAGPSMVPTATLFDAWRAEGGDIDAVADWYGLPLPEARAAVDFEVELRRPREALAA